MGCCSSKDGTRQETEQAKPHDAPFTDPSAKRLSVDHRRKQQLNDAAQEWLRSMSTICPSPKSAPVAQGDRAAADDELPVMVLPTAFVTKVAPFTFFGPPAAPADEASTPAVKETAASVPAEDHLGASVIDGQRSAVVSIVRKPIDLGSMKQAQARSCRSTLKPSAAGPVAVVVVPDQGHEQPHRAARVGVSAMERLSNAKPAPLLDESSAPAKEGEAKPPRRPVLDDSITASQDRDARALAAFLARVTHAENSTSRSAVAVLRPNRGDGGARVTAALLRGHRAVQTVEVHADSDDDGSRIEDAPQVRRGQRAASTPQKSPGVEVDANAGNGPKKAPKPSADGDRAAPNTSSNNTIAANPLAVAHLGGGDSTPPRPSRDAEAATPVYSPREDTTASPATVAPHPEAPPRGNVETGVATWFVTPSAHRKPLQLKSNSETSVPDRRRSSGTTRASADAPIAPVGLPTRLVQYWCTRAALLPVVPALSDTRSPFTVTPAPPSLTEWGLRATADLTL